jgi:hypothetical protein
MREQALADRPVVGGGLGRRRLGDGEPAQEVRPADDADSAIAAHHQHPLDPPPLEQAATSASGASTSTVTTSVVITSAARRPCVFR